MRKLFIIAAGGTGMRCLESFVHLCAIGMFDGDDIHVLTIDTDRGNGNKKRTEDLIRNYRQIKSPGKDDGGSPNHNTFFSAKISLYSFCPNYQSAERGDFQKIADPFSGTPEERADNEALCDLLLDQRTQKFNLAHGYRAKTHLGSLLMHHEIVESARRRRYGRSTPDDDQLFGFLNELLKSDDARVFIFGSAFGGTGASTIPVLPLALREASRVWRADDDKQGTGLDFKKAKFAAVLLTEYFSFRPPEEADKRSAAEGVIADPLLFKLNCQAALSFYEADPSIKEPYQALYHVGWPLDSGELEPPGTDRNELKTGGARQLNDCHLAELMSACAAFDFFKRADERGSGDRSHAYFRALPFENDHFHVEAQDLFGPDDSDWKRFLARLTAFHALAHIVLHKNGGRTGGNGAGALLARIRQHGLAGYEALTETETKRLDTYFQNYGYKGDGKFEEGWIYQLRRSVDRGAFLLSDTAFPSAAELQKEFDIGTLTRDKSHHWDGGMLNRASVREENFVKRLTDRASEPDTAKQSVNTPMERFIARLHNALIALPKKPIQ